MARDFIYMKDGDQIAPYHFNQIYDELNRWRKLRGSGHVSVNGAKDGTSVPSIDVTIPRDGYVCVAGNGGISAAVNSTVGSGSAIIYQRDGSSLVELTANGASLTELTVYNAARDTANGTVLGSISAGTRVWVQRDAFGDYWVAPLECEDPV
jgi:hypothetical protein